MGKTEQKSKTELRLKAYQRAINKIDDWFEYDMAECIAGALGLPERYVFGTTQGMKRSYEEARSFVYKTLGELMEELIETK